MDVNKLVSSFLPVTNKPESNPVSSNFLPIDLDNMDPRLFTPEFARMFGGYGALSQIHPPDYDDRTDVYSRTVGSKFDAPLSASSTLFNYLTVTPGFTKVSSLNYQMYRDAKIQMYTPVRYCDKSDPLRDGKVVLDSRGLIASMVPVLEKELPNAEQFANYQPIGDDRNKRVNLTPDEDDDGPEILNVTGIGVYNPNFLFFVKATDVTLEKMTAAINAMTGRTGLSRQRKEKKTEEQKVMKVAGENAEKNAAISAQQTKKQEAVSNALNNGGFMYDISDLLRDDRSVNFLNDSLAQYDIYESPLVGGGAKTFVGNFGGIDVTCEGVINSFKLTLNVFKPVSPAVMGVLIGSTALKISPEARTIDTTTLKYWVNTLEKNLFDSNPNNSDYQERLKNYSLLEQKSVEELELDIGNQDKTELMLALDNYKRKIQTFDAFVAGRAKENPFFKKITKDDSGTVYTTLAGFDCYGYEFGVNKTTPVYMGKLQSVKGENVAFKKWHKPKMNGAPNHSCDSNYSLSNYDIYIFQMPEDAVTNGVVKNRFDVSDKSKLLDIFIKYSLGPQNVSQAPALGSPYNDAARILGSDQTQTYVNLIKKINESKMFYTSYDKSVPANKIINVDTIFWEPFMKIDVEDIKQAADFLKNVDILKDNLVKAFNLKKRTNSVGTKNSVPQTVAPIPIGMFGPNEERKEEDDSLDVAQTIPQTLSDVSVAQNDDSIQVGDYVEIVDKNFDCGGIKNLKYAKVSEITGVGRNNKNFGKFANAYNLVIFSSISDFLNADKRASCVVYDTNKLKRVSPDEVETFLKPTYVPFDGGAKHTRRSHTGPRKRVTRHGNRILMRRRTYKGRKRIAHSKTVKK